MVSLLPPTLQTLTQNRDQRLGGAHRHGEDGACVLALIRKGHAANADTQLIWGRLYQLNPVVSKGWVGARGLYAPPA